MESSQQLLNFIPDASLLALQKEIGSIHAGATVLYWSKGWSMHELLLFLLAQTGPSKLLLSSFSVSEEAVRAFALAKEKRLITDFSVLFDYTTKRHKADFLNFFHNVTPNIRIYPNHSKAFVLDGPLPIAVLSSQNLNRNHRVECGVVTSVATEVERLKAKFQSFFDQSTPVWNSQENKLNA